MSSMADEALRLASSSRAALAARSRPSGSKPVTEEPPARLLGGFSGVITLERDSSLFFLPAPPNILYFIGFGLELLELGYCAGLQLFMSTAGSCRRRPWAPAFCGGGVGLWMWGERFHSTYVGINIGSGGRKSRAKPDRQVSAVFGDK